MSDHDPSHAAATRREVLGRLADEGTPVIVSHFPGIGPIARFGDGFRWVSSAKEQETPVE